jgi:alkylation response protein AidB-like acyl-CoA dehydrogenase
VMGCAETSGALQRVFDFTLEYAFDRHSFGRPLASYQALKHRFADLKLWVEACAGATTGAARALQNSDGNAAEMVSAAKSYIGNHAHEVIQDCVQLHGGIGVTWDHDLHLFLRRVTVNGVSHGTPNAHRELLASLIGL